MPRRKSKNVGREILPDGRFDSVVVHKMINVIMRCGNKSAARRIVYGAIDLLTKRADGNDRVGYALFEKAIEQVRPLVEVRARRVGGGVYQVPVEVRPERALMLAMRWIVDGASKRADKSMDQRLAGELFDAVEGRGGACKKKADVHKMAESNRAFSHYAW